MLRRAAGLPLRMLLPASKIPLPDLSVPTGEAALVPPDSVSWRVFKNPVALFVGGVGAVLLELAEPRVRSGVWDFTSFRTDPLARMQRTGVAAMITVYGPRSLAEANIVRVNRLHEAVRGETPNGVSYTANDPHLLNWVQATAAYGFLEAYCAFVAPLQQRDKDRFYAEGEAAARLYGADSPPRSVRGWEERLATMLPELEASPIIFEFLEILDRTRVFPMPLRGLQKQMIRAAIEITPPQVRERLGLGGQWDLRPRQRKAIQRLGALSEKLYLDTSPPAAASVRLGLPPGYLYGAGASAAVT